MKALVFNQYGGADNIAFAETSRPVPKPDEILVQVHAAGLNPIDCAIPKGTFKPILRFQLPATLGSDLAGIVVETGSRVTRFKPGDAVFASIFDLGTGALAEFARVPQSAAAPKPPNLDFVQAASIPMVGLTSWQALKERAPQARAKGVHPGRFRRHRHVRDPTREIPWRKGGDDNQHRKRGLGAQPWRRRGDRLQEPGI